MPDAQAWVAAQLTAVGCPIALTAILRVVADTGAVEFLAEDQRRVVVTLFSAAELRKAERSLRGRLAQAMHTPLLGDGRKVVSFERSLLNAGDYFDLEAAQAGQLLHVPGWQDAPRLWFHVLPARKGATA